MNKMSFINMSPMDAYTYWLCEKCGWTVIASGFSVKQNCLICHEKCKQITAYKYFELNPTTNH